MTAHAASFPAPGVRTCAVIPVFDNESTVADVALSVAGHVDLVVVVDDGSRDGSGDAVRAAARSLPRGRAIDVVTVRRNRGKGNALVAGLRHAQDMGYTHAVTLDADAQHLASDIPAFLAAARAHPSAVVVGARDMDSDRVPNAARVGRRVSNFWTKRTTGFDLPDTTCGFRVYPVDAVLALGVRTCRYDFEGEVLVRAAWAGLELRSVPIDVWYPAKRAERVSHYRPWVDSIRVTRMYVRLGLGRLVPGRGTVRREPRVRVPRRDLATRLRETNAAATQTNELALAIGVGAFLGATPLWGLHTFLALWVATRWRLNAVAAFLATNVSFPPFAPALVFAEVQFGHRLLSGDWLPVSRDEFRLADVASHLADYVAGGFAFAALLGIAAGLATLGLGAALERRRPAAAVVLRRPAA